MLRKYIEQYSGSTLTEEEFALVTASFRPRHLRKKQYFLQEGDVSKNMAFIVKGAMRQYSVDEKGGEHIIFLCTENWWVGDRESFTMLTPSRYNIDAVEDSDILVTTSEAFQGLVDKIPAINNMIRTMDQRNSIANQKRIHSAISLTAEERYFSLLESNPALFQRFPQNMIASYLGISAETLSRIRKKPRTTDH
ncbi:Crp/Fnr family transcriptional regulator [Ferruginibacter sp. HRS2-29]|uniref:Crp/Fnr family transcriptional regulator n=1 Tax=Ferruginibacter sp. HRS2-29 TaxID=2487334 RepID=UPI0020CD0EBB|nr:Crp/Fnr family transcriptional regulator [Ferruginibacter sp. HRS2-29]